MMFFLHSKFSFELIALVAGVALLIYFKNQTKIKSIWPLFVAWFVIILSALSIICSVYHSVTCWNRGYCDMHKRMWLQKNMTDMRNKR